MRLWQTIRTSELGWHIHQDAYAALVLSGGYEEAGDRGRFRVEAGHVVFHDCFEAHLDRFSTTGAVLLNFPLPPQAGCSFGIAQVADIDAVVRAAEKSRLDGLEVLLHTASAEKQSATDWPDELAAALLQNSSIKLCQWAEQRVSRLGLYRAVSARSSVSRQKCFERAPVPVEHGRGSRGQMNPWRTSRRILASPTSRT